jgi:hypothetical protein
MYKTVNSLSGGKTSSYMALNYKADYNVFALVTIESDGFSKLDKNMKKWVSDKIGGYDFIGTMESDKTLYIIRDLEQKMGSEINWVVGESFESVCTNKNGSLYLPNFMNRSCTTKMKLKPIFDFCQTIAPIIDMRIGFRFDEKERAEKNQNNTHFKTIIGQNKNGTNKWREIEWRKLSFPLVQNRISNFEVVKWAKKSGLDFPLDSNCVGCFWKPQQQLRKNFEDEAIKMAWFEEMELKSGKRWKKETTYRNIKKLGLQQDFFFGTGSGCQAGFCTD